MNKQELINKLADRSGVNKIVATRFLETLTTLIQAEVAAGGEVKITGFGTFDCKLYKSHLGRNPKTGEPLVIPDVPRPKFTASVKFKQLVKNQGKA